MKIILIMLLLSTTSILLASPTPHSHGGRVHTHALPSTGVDHRHGAGAIGSLVNLKRGTVEKKSSHLVQNQVINIGNPWAWSDKLRKGENISLPPSAELLILKKMKAAIKARSGEYDRYGQVADMKASYYTFMSAVKSPAAQLFAINEDEQIIDDFTTLSPSLKNDPRVLKRRGYQRGATSPAPRNYLKIIKQHMNERLNDPRSVIDFSATKPVFAKCILSDPGREVFGWLVDVKYNAKNQYGGYAGLSKIRYVLQGEKFEIISSGWRCVSQGKELN